MAKLEAPAEGEAYTALNIAKAIVRREVDHLLKDTGMRRWMAKQQLGREMKIVTLADGSATTRVDWSIEEVRNALITPVRRTP